MCSMNSQRETASPVFSADFRGHDAVEERACVSVEHHIGFGFFSLSSEPCAIR